MKKDLYLCTFQKWAWKKGCQAVSSSNLEASWTQSCCTTGLLALPFEKSAKKKRTIATITDAQIRTWGVTGTNFYSDLVGLDELITRERLFAGVQRGLSKPTTPPTFPPDRIVAKGFGILLHRCSTFFKHKFKVQYRQLNSNQEKRMEDRTNIGTSKPTFLPVKLDDDTIIRIEATQVEGKLYVRATLPQWSCLHFSNSPIQLKVW